jgi:putative DNA primase/helicase
VTAASIPQTPLAMVLDRLTANGCKPVQRGGSWNAKCPAHADSTPSLTVSQSGDGRVLVNCFAGCKAEAVVAALGLTMRDLYAQKASAQRPREEYDPNARPSHVATYDYVDADGTLRFQALRLRKPDGGKTFRQRQPHPTKAGEWQNDMKGVDPILYRLPSLIEALAEERTVYVTEGEKDADTLAGYGYASTCNVGGAGKWRESYSPLFRGAGVVVCQDNDDAGKSHAEQVAASLTAAGAAWVKVIAFPGVPPKGDVSDWLAEPGNDLDAFASLVNRTRFWTPDKGARTRWRLDELLLDDDVMRPPPAVVPRLAYSSRSTLFASAPKAGKSTVTGYIAAAVTRGSHFLDDACTPGTVLVVGLEEYIGDAARRLRHFDADPTRCYLVDTLPSDPLERPAALRAHVEAVKPVLVIVDTLIAYGGGSVTDLNAAAQVGPVVQEITDLAHELGPAVILVHHAKKADGKYRDSSAIGGAVDVIAEMFAPDQDADPTLRQVRVVGRVPGGDFRMRYDGRHFTLDAVTELQSADLPIDQRIVAAIRSRPGCHANTVADLVGANRQIVLATISRLLAEGQLQDRGEGTGKRLLHVP